MDMSFFETIPIYLLYVSITLFILLSFEIGQVGQEAMIDLQGRMN